MSKNYIKSFLLCFLIAVLSISCLSAYAADGKPANTPPESVSTPKMPDNVQPAEHPSDSEHPPVPPIVKYSSDKISSLFLSSAKISTTGMSLVDYKKTWDFSSITQVETAYKGTKLDLGRRYRYSELEAVWKSLADKKLYTLEIIGKSADKRNIYALKLGSGKKSVLITAGVHARETSNPLFITKFLIELTNSYRSNISYAGVNARNLLDKELTLYIIPCVNPDGYEMTQFPNSIKTNLPAKGIKSLSGAKSNANLVDLNRNFPNYSSAILWKNTKRTIYYSTNPSIQFYAGKALGNQPETQTVMMFVQKYLTKDTKLFIDLHSGGSIVYGGKPHLSDSFNSLCRKFRDVFVKNSGYKVALDETTGQDSDGTVTDFVAEYINSYTFNTALGRMIPTGGVSKLVTKSNQKRLSQAAVMSIETLPSGLSRPVDPSIQAREWTRANIPKSIMSTIVYNP
jgi:Predicted carboxypeptidase